jgi:hypothetical protein
MGSRRNSLPSRNAKTDIDGNKEELIEKLREYE